jgi:ferrous iron transport protein A
MAIQPQPLDRCRKGATAVISTIEADSRFGEHDALVTRRLKELGFLPGTTVRVIGHGLFGADPIAVRINGTKFALRHAEAGKIMVMPQGCVP